MTFRHERAHYYDEDPVRARNLRQYHRSERTIAGLIGTETCHPPRFSIPRHAHVLPSFYVMLAGSLTEYDARNQRAVEKYNLVFMPEGEIHSNRFHDAGGRCFLVELTTEWVTRLDGAGVQLAGPQVASNEAARLAIRLHREFSHVDSASALAAEGLTLEIIAAIARHAATAPSAITPRWVRAARDLLHDRLAETLTLAAIAGQVDVHPAQLVRTFRKVYGCTPGEYQRRLRVEHASRQLMSTRQRLADIALAAGFADQAHFSRVFRKHTGMSPGKYRATNQPR